MEILQTNNDVGDKPVLSCIRGRSAKQKFVNQFFSQSAGAIVQMTTDNMVRQKYHHTSMLFHMWFRPKVLRCGM